VTVSERVSVGRTAGFARFLGMALALVALLMAVGLVPTRRLGGTEAVTSMAVGCAISFLSAVLAAWLLTAVRADSPAARMQRAFLAMVARLAVVVVLGLAAALSGEFARMPLLLWLATSYVVLLPLEVMLAIAE
jgi:hypothetical protein